MFKMFDDYKEFLVSHYLGGRTDSEFWRYITAGNTLTDFNINLSFVSNKLLNFFVTQIKN